MEPSAHDTLRLRAFYRLLLRQEGKVPSEYWSFLEAVSGGRAIDPAVYFAAGRWNRHWAVAEDEALQLTLGRESDNRSLFDRIRSIRKLYDELVLIGGPPCQAYSLVGRARQKNVKGFRTNGVTKHFLYRQYLDILAEFKPAVFIMENVRGILTSKVGERGMFDAILEDLSDPPKALGIRRRGGTGRYVLLPIHVVPGQSRDEESVREDPSGFVIRCENHGVPQARHRVIVMGVRADCMSPAIAHVRGLTAMDEHRCIEDALGGLPPLRSGLSRVADDSYQWRCAMDGERERLIRILGGRYPEVADVLHEITPSDGLPRRSVGYASRPKGWAADLRQTEQAVVLNHDTRGHMKSDLGRYMFCAAFASVNERSPKSSEFPKRLAPTHKNWKTGDFADRFRVQLPDRPSNTITSHLSKDGHAFIHWDPSQCRSLTVREAARLQTFPDDYLFLGNRTEQYVQVGNAVPPLVARQIARVVCDILPGS